MKKLEDMTEPELQRLMQAMGAAVECAAEYEGVERPMFCLLLFNDPAAVQYVANCERPEIIKAMRECADRLERKEDIPR